MHPAKRVEVFEKLIRNKFDLYNSLFLNLPYSKIRNIGILLPMLYQVGKQGLEAQQQPREILDAFLQNYVNLETEEEKIDFMFKVIQYVERQVVLFDSVEDAAFKSLNELGSDLSLKDVLQASDSKKRWKAIADKLSTFSARIVFTAHPTQFYPLSVLDIIHHLSGLITENRIDEIDASLQQLGLTSLIYTQKPTPLEEAKNIIYYLRNVYYNATGKFYSFIKDQIHWDDFENPDLIKLGFWPGGDRDGNPFVTAETTMEVADELRMTLMKCYYDDVKKLKQKLTFRHIEERLNELGNLLYTAMFHPDASIHYEDIISPLQEVRELLVNHYHSLNIHLLDELLIKVKIFRTHFASLDIRQDHRIHKKVVETILQKEQIIKEELEELSSEELIQVLLHPNLKIEALDFEEEIVRDTILNISQLASIQEKNGEEGCNRYIISNSEDIFSVLFVYALFRWCGWQNHPIHFDIVPLFETMKGMDDAKATLQTLFDLPEYKAHLVQRKNRQTIMLGFSDGTKDGGYLKANWEIYKTKEKLSEVCSNNQIQAIFFDGRGGPPARGGGKTHRFYAAQGKGIANQEIQLTIQGQTITSKYGTPEQFMHNCEQLLTAVLSNDFMGKKNEISSKSRELLEELSQISLEKYEALKSHQLFVPYLENRSTLKYYAKANIASRPTKRGTKKKLELSDLRAISFVGSWSQLKQNVPGYFGLGTAIKALIEKGQLEELKELFDEVPFFKALLLNSMMSLSKCDFKLTAYMKEDKEYREFWNLLHDEYQLSKEMLLLISDSKILMEEEPISRESIKIRERIVLPLLLIQQYALQKIYQGSSKKDQYEKIVTRSLYGNINASRNSV